MLNFFNVLIKQKHLFHSMPKRIRKPNINFHRKINTPPIKKHKTEKNSTRNLNLFVEKMDLTSKIEVLNSPVKSANDKKEYKVIRLENGLVACLISDPSINFENIVSDDELSENESTEESETGETEESESEFSGAESEDNNERRSNKLQEVEEKLAAASLCVGVGSFSDPDSIPGLAHFLEHMVFMGSEKYQQENEFDAFLKKRGGNDNASTDCETTTFYFECLEKYLGKALDMWSQFFIAPLMKEDSMTREREAIESEFQMALPSDTHRKEQMLVSFAKSDSPVNKFMWGNLKTLRDDVSDEILYKSVHEFRKRHYSAHRMTLAVQARLPLDILENYVINCFSNIPNNNLSADDFKSYADNVYNTPKFNRMYYIKPMKDVHQIDLTFAMPSLLHLYKSKPHQYVSWLLGHEGKGSLLSYLKQKTWVHGIYTGNAESGMEHNSLYALFTVTLVLTPNGLNHICEIIEAVFSYISLLKEVGPQERIYNEIKTIDDTNFRFKEEETASDFVEDLAQAMHYYPPEDYITGTELYMEYNPEAISMVIDKLNPNNVNIMILSSTVPENIKYEKCEPWFSVEYTDLDIPSIWTQKWLNVKPFNCFSLPSDNKFLAKNFDLLNIPDDLIPTYPEKLFDSELSELWYKPDNKFKLPHAFMQYYFINNCALDSAKSSCMIDLFVNILIYQLTEEVYPAHVAELSYMICSHDYGIMVKVNGYNDKLPLLLDLLLEYFIKVPSATSMELFKIVKDIQTKCYHNTFIKPAKLAKGIRLSVLQNKCWNALAKYNAINTITYDAFLEFSNNFLKCMHIQGLIQGNISKEIALDVNRNIIASMNFESIAAYKVSKIRVQEIPVGKFCLKVESFHKNDSNSIVTNYFQVGPGNIKLHVTLDILMLIMEEPLFDILRTKEQLGYDVHCMLNDTYGILGYSITVNTHAKKFTTEHVDKRIEEFIRHLSKTIKKMPEKKINEIKENLIKIKQVADVHLRDEVSRNWNEIVQQDFMFDRIPREIDAIREIKISDIRKCLETYSIDKNCSRKLSVQVAGHDTDATKCAKNEIGVASVSDLNTYPVLEEIQLKFIDNAENNNGYKFITNIEDYKTKLYLMPEHKITN